MPDCSRAVSSARAIRCSKTFLSTTGEYILQRETESQALQLISDCTTCLFWQYAKRVGGFLVLAVCQKSRWIWGCLKKSLRNASLTSDKINSESENKIISGLDVSPKNNFLYPAVSFLLPTAALTTHTKSVTQPKKNNLEIRCDCIRVWELQG